MYTTVSFELSGFTAPGFTGLITRISQTDLQWILQSYNIALDKQVSLLIQQHNMGYGVAFFVFVLHSRSPEKPALTKYEKAFAEQITFPIRHL